MKRKSWLWLLLLAFAACLVLIALNGFNSALFCGPLFFYNPLLYPLVALVCLILYVWALISILTSGKLDGGSKIAWILVLLVLPVVGFVVWLLFGPKK